MALSAKKEKHEGVCVLGAKVWRRFPPWAAVDRVAHVHPREPAHSGLFWWERRVTSHQWYRRTVRADQTTGLFP